MGVRLLFGSAAALEALAFADGARALPLLEAALTHEYKQIHEAAAKGLARHAGLKDPIRLAVDRESEVGFDRLSPAQRVVYCGFLFDMEISNGGILQFFGNSSGDLKGHEGEAPAEPDHFAAAAEA